ncbi:nuclear transport factor 2 family protein [Hyphobacterium sp. CCMP332]|jgi:limonene-1,2-epoxide hydrolase|uniref:nuclear transport factor 2 family protein n=1 Tax=Hyphobacterium sp. CCMP332 TaxID=2749086 RepID=UPI00164F30C2|nr:nuclear transport factor 2 family protein [Hyphobacterium sp. CCMP332]QNL19837.1 nuclear transport factor 2 family protein [Hyphobacterium sp. CCMP332]
MKLLFSGLLFCLGCLWADTLAQDSTPSRQIADAWLTAYQAQDFDAARGLLTHESVFIDPTSFGRENFGEPINWTGADAIISGISSWGLAGAEYSFDRVYESPGRVIYDGSVLVTYQNGARYDFPIITIVTVADGHLVEHRDYTDFDGAVRLESN